MITRFRSSELYLASQLKETVRRQLQALPQKISSLGTVKNILRFEFPCEEINPLTWLHNQRTDEKIYWSDRLGHFETAGVGSAKVLAHKSFIPLTELFEEMEESLSADNPHLRFYGGFAFNRQSAPEWDLYGQSRFVVPLFELTQANETLFAVNIAVENTSETEIARVLKILDEISFEKQTSYRQAPVVQSRVDMPNEKEWLSILNSLKAKDGSWPFEKMVLARKSQFRFDKYINPVALLNFLKDMTPHCYHFCFQPKHKFGFVGASPECLYKRVGRTIQSEALAGTVHRGASPQEDTQLKKQLTQSPKNLREHQFVVDSVGGALTGLCQELDIAEPCSVVQYKHFQHLMTSFKGILKEGISDSQVLSALHPTPALAGIPKEETLALIEQTEPFVRGWYAAPVGYVGYDHAEFAVGIRSALIEESQLSLYAGAGIVEGSDPHEEWREVENKISNFISVFNQS